jgi:hypothetical protein
MAEVKSRPQNIAGKTQTFSMPVFGPNQKLHFMLVHTG